MVLKDFPVSSLDPDDDGAADLVFEESDVDAMARALLAQHQGSWRLPDGPIDLRNGVRWVPRLRTGPKGLVHIHATPQVSESWLRRMRLSTDMGFQIHVAAPLELWYSAETLCALDSIGVHTLVLAPDGDLGWKIKARYRSVPELISSGKLVIGPDALQEIGNRALGRALAAPTANEKGWRFEDFLCLLFSQVSYFEVFERNYRNKTQEIDIVLRDRRISGSPLALVSGKNLAAPVESDALTSLRAKMAGRRGQCKLGFLCVSRTFTSSVQIDEIGNRLADSVVVTLDGKDLRRLMERAAELDQEIERLIIEAALT